MQNPVVISLHHPRAHLCNANDAVSRLAGLSGAQSVDWHFIFDVINASYDLILSAVFTFYVPHLLIGKKEKTTSKWSPLHNHHEQSPIPPHPSKNCYLYTLSTVGHDVYTDHFESTNSRRRIIPGSSYESLIQWPQIFLDSVVAFLCGYGWASELNLSSAIEIKPKFFFQLNYLSWTASAMSTIVADSPSSSTCNWRFLVDDVRNTHIVDNTFLLLALLASIADILIFM